MGKIRFTVRGAVGGFAVFFGLLTMLSGSLALFGGEEAKAAAGDVVPFVLWFNTVAGLAYVAAGLAILSRSRLALPLSAAIAVATGGVMALFYVHVLQGGAYEIRTVFALGFRFAVWVALSAIAWRAVGGSHGT
ncbi:hypothetical protein [Thalassovita sp.]|uniref:hypothetical protein n=1 Tax=Thalassovita sp. TaxID=1979401 RepID=UPI0029DE84C8|nr:hypothetical protein [Thalassovita sp.]